MSQSDLLVAMTPEPVKNLSDSEAEQVYTAIFDATVQAATTTTSAECPFAPIFRRRPFPREGVLKMKCENEDTIAWFRKTPAIT